MFVIEDTIHAELSGKFPTSDDAIVDLNCRASIPWNESPNRAPCTSWKTCGRDYVIVECDDRTTPWTTLREIPALQISADGIAWAPGIGGPSPV